MKKGNFRICVSDLQKVYFQFIFWMEYTMNSHVSARKHIIIHSLTIVFGAVHHDEIDGKSYEWAVLFMNAKSSCEL